MQFQQLEHRQNIPKKDLDVHVQQLESGQNIQNSRINNVKKTIFIQLITIACIAALHVICLAIVACATGSNFVLFVSTFINNGIPMLCVAFTAFMTLAQCIFVTHKEQSSLQNNSHQDHWSKYKKIYIFLVPAILVNAICTFPCGMIASLDFVLVPALLISVLIVLHLIYRFIYESSPSDRVDSRNNSQSSTADFTNIEAGELLT